jgi:hypothetical protein
MLNEQKTGIVVSELNTVSGTLAAAASFVGAFEDIRRYAETTVNLYGTPAIAPGILFFEYSPDGINVDISVPYSLSGPRSFVPLPLRTVLPFFRVRYVNGATPLTEFRLTTVFHWEGAKHITRVINQTIDDNEPVENVRAFIGGKSPDGPFTNLPSGGMVTSQSTNTLLGIGESFNSAGIIVPTSGYVAAAVTINADVASATSGVVFQWFADSAGTRLLKESIFTYGTPGVGVNISVPIQAPYYRVKYENGTIAQTSFELQSLLIVTAPPPDVLAISDTITGNNAASITKAQIVGQREDGAYASSRLSNSNSQMVAIADRPSEVRGRTRVVIPVNRTTISALGTVLYTVTVGKTLYISAFAFSQLNDNIAIGEWRLRDSAIIKSGFIMAPRSGSIPDAQASTSPTLPEPINFSTNVNLISITGTIIVAGFLIGYEE